MSEVTVKIPNLKKLQRAFAQSSRITSKYVNKAIEASIWKIAGTSVRLCPVDTGFLRETIQLGVGFNQMEGFIVPLAEYAIYVHEGTSFMRARPFLKKASERERRNVERYFEQALEWIAEDIARKAR